MLSQYLTYLNGAFSFAVITVAFALTIALVCVTIYWLGCFFFWLTFRFDELKINWSDEAELFLEFADYKQKQVEAEQNAQKASDSDSEGAGKGSINA